MRINVEVWRGCAGCSNKEVGGMLKELFQASYFRMTVVPDGQTVEVCGALKVSFFLIHSFIDSFFHLLIHSFICIRQLRSID